MGTKSLTHVSLNRVGREIGFGLLTHTLDCKSYQMVNACLSLSLPVALSWPFSIIIFRKSSQTEITYILLFTIFNSDGQLQLDQFSPLEKRGGEKGLHNS